MTTQADGTDRAGSSDYFWAGLQAGMGAILWMLALLNVAGLLRARGFWWPENLMATLFDDAAAGFRRLHFTTFSGLAVYLILYSLLGAGFAWVVRNRVSNTRRVLLGVLAGIGWYYLAYHGLWKAVLPAVASLHPQRDTLWAHCLFGLLVARYPVYLPRPAAQASPVAPPAAQEPRSEPAAMAMAVQNETGARPAPQAPSEGASGTGEAPVSD
jgi:hypothetical protein